VSYLLRDGGTEAREAQISDSDRIEQIVPAYPLQLPHLHRVRQRVRGYD
jgi:hypothetical protein